MSYANSSSEYINPSIKNISVYGSQLTTITTASSSLNSKTVLSETDLDDEELYILIYTI